MLSNVSPFAFNTVSNLLRIDSYNFWIASIWMLSIRSSPSSFRDIGGENWLFTLLYKTTHSGLIIFKSGIGQGRCWNSSWSSNCADFMITTLYFSIAAPSWMLDLWSSQLLFFRASRVFKVNTELFCSNSVLFGHNPKSGHALCVQS